MCLVDQRGVVVSAFTILKAFHPSPSPPILSPHKVLKDRAKHQHWKSQTMQVVVGHGSYQKAILVPTQAFHESRCVTAICFSVKVWSSHTAGLALLYLYRQPQNTKQT